MRTVEVKRCGKWKACELSEIKKDEMFRLFDDGKRVVNEKGQSSWIARGRAVLNKDKVFVIDVYR